MVRRVDAVSCAEGSEHLGWKLQIGYVDYLVAVKSELSPGHTHHNRIPFSIVTMPQHRRFKILVEGIIRRCAVGREAV